jgi:hypothetical protein
MGGAGEALVIDPAGQVFRGGYQSGGFTQTALGKFAIAYSKLRPL